MGKRARLGLCAACRRRRPLCASDVLSVFVIRPLKHGDGLFYDLRSGPQPKARLWGDGVWEHLLCEECEGRRNRMETYVAALLHEPRRLTIPVAGGCAWNRSDYTRLKLFQMWTLWMAHVSTREFFAHVNLGAAHGERLRQMLLADDPGRAWEYSCLMWALLLDGVQRKEFVCSPVGTAFRDYNRYLFFFGGFVWEYPVAHDVRRHFSKRLVLQEDGQFVTLAFEIRGSDFERFLLEELAFPNWDKVDNLRARLEVRTRERGAPRPSVP